MCAVREGCMGCSFCDEEVSAIEHIVCEKRRMEALRFKGLPTLTTKLGDFLIAGLIKRRV